MKKIKKIGGLVAVFLLNFYNTCFADVVSINPQTGEKAYHGTGRDLIYPEPNLEPIIIGILVLVIVICAVIIIRRIIKKKKEKSNDNK